MGLNIKDLPLDSCYISPYNVRSDPGDLTELIASIRDLGVLEPILVRQMGKQYQVIAGRRRLEAARSLGLPTIPASVLDVDDLPAIIISLIENIQRKDLTLEERVETYQTLQQLDPEFRNLHRLAEVVTVSHQKLSQDFQAYAVLRKLQPRGFTLASHLPRSAVERQQGTALPQYHLVLLHQAMATLTEAGVDPEEVDEKLAELAGLIAPLSQDRAEELIKQVKEQPESLDAPDNQPVDEPIFQQKHSASQSFAASRHRSKPARQQDEGASIAPREEPASEDAVGCVMCEHCGHHLTLLHLSDGTHQVKQQHPGETQQNGAGGVAEEQNGESPRKR
jgi:ParB/RepB/Spo0J family partition protein